ncbi:MAG TPA: hypothetical protein VG100_12775 [Xanthobacteraceae bacterium]|jgi:hypothetical protein|nr:hypothetical protein [Xanthobacteraceae bacterium]
MSVPTTYTLNVDLTAPIILDVGGTTPITLDVGGTTTPIGLTVTLAPIKIEPLDLSIRLKELPSIRAHFPVDYTVCLSLLGSEFLSVRLCGQGQVITEPYVPNPCECRYLDLKPDAGAVASP